MALLFAIEGLEGSPSSGDRRSLSSSRTARGPSIYGVVARLGCGVRAVALCLGRDSDRQQLVETHTRRPGHLNILVNNASKQISGHRSYTRPLSGIPTVASQYRTKDRGYRHRSEVVDYSATKGAMTSFTRSLSE
ncbi:hypothetical protein PAXRUDRAFT_791585 [Paxillus rubicundulus Ve08.2h10]|uniref:Uncharacterized protein n=1 Tax=Paxillus rubicundulus Ve08.2h10 TaxID=930991 RepID=A0A0D0DMD3_9AGAM|nr:hypothetical protein PAXRUDRAFT_791585 [Paxillus rubicundulus Ve08.2h10]